MCDYSLHAAKTRDAAVDDKLVVGKIAIEIHDHFGIMSTVTSTSAFHAEGDSETAVCLRPGTELSFSEPVKYGKWEHPYDKVLSVIRTEHTTAIFRKVNEQSPYLHHDAVELPDGAVVLINDLLGGQRARVLQLPAEKVLTTATDVQSTAQLKPMLA